MFNFGRIKQNISRASDNFNPFDRDFQRNARTQVNNKVVQPSIRFAKVQVPRAINREITQPIVKPAVNYFKSTAPQIKQNYVTLGDNIGEFSGFRDAARASAKIVNKAAPKVISEDYLMNTNQNKLGRVIYGKDPAGTLKSTANVNKDFAKGLGANEGTARAYGVGATGLGVMLGVLPGSSRAKQGADLIANANTPKTALAAAKKLGLKTDPASIKKIINTVDPKQSQKLIDSAKSTIKPLTKGGEKVNVVGDQELRRISDEVRAFYNKPVKKSASNAGVGSVSYYKHKIRSQYPGSSAISVGDNDVAFMLNDKIVTVSKSNLSTPNVAKVQTPKVAPKTSRAKIGTAELPLKSGAGQTKSIVNQADQLPSTAPIAPKLSKVTLSSGDIIPQDGKNVRGFAKNIAKDKVTPANLPVEIPGYTKITNKGTLTRAANEINSNPNAVYEELISRGRNLSVDQQAKAQLLIRKFINDGNNEAAQQVANLTARNATEGAQAMQILSAYNKMTPEGSLRDLSRMVNDFNIKNPNKQIAIDPRVTKQVTEIAQRLEKLEPNTREWQKAAAELEKVKADAIPLSALGKINKLQTMAQLLNPKTAIRNILGNGILDFAEDASRLTAAGIDKALYKLGFIKERNLLAPNIKTNWLGKMTGFKMGVEDVNLGIRTSGSQGQFQITKDVFKEGTVGNKLEKLLGYELSSFDKAFYTGRYQSSLENMMKAKKVDSPESWMIGQAEAEALYATFQNNSAIAGYLSKTKQGLNVGKEWGIGDLVLKYPKTPGNIVSVGLDYSPIGFVKGLKQFHDSAKFADPTMQREAILNLSRGLTGSGMILGGAMLAKQGIITGQAEKDYDIRQLNRESGQGPFSFNFSALGRMLEGGDTKPQNGDVMANYDWLQPNAIQLSMGANMVLNKGDANSQINDAFDSIGAGVDTITQQPLFSGVQKIFSDLNPNTGGSIGKAMTGVATGLPASFMPSVINQAGQLFDKNSRSTYDPSAFNTAFNKVKARIPGVRNTLEPQISSQTGRPIEQYQQGSILTNNNPINVFLNPAFIRKYNMSPEAQEVIDIYKRSGETQQAPRIMDKKIKINGENRELTSQEYRKYQEYVGSRVQPAYSEMIASADYQAKSDEDRAKALSGLLTDINKDAKIELFGQESTKTATKTSKKTLGTLKLKKSTKGKKGRKLKAVKTPKPPKIKIGSSKLKSVKLKSKKLKLAKLKTPKV